MALHRVQMEALPQQGLETRDNGQRVLEQVTVQAAEARHATVPRTKERHILFNLRWLIVKAIRGKQAGDIF